VAAIDDFTSEPVIRVGLLSAVPSAEITLQGTFVTQTGQRTPEGSYQVRASGDGIELAGVIDLAGRNIVLRPADPTRCRFTVHGITIGIQFHWERKESQSFEGALALERIEDGINVVNEIPIEAYLASVISSEMSASSPGELLRAHAIVSRSWLLFQLRGPVSSELASTAPREDADQYDDQIIRWYDRQSHSEFDVCADDHCQRYQGTTKAASPAVFEAINATRGRVLVFGDQICDARYSKSCGGMTECYSAAWEDVSVPYLKPVYDGAGNPYGFALPLTEEGNARDWIISSPPAFCNVGSPELLARILPGFDQETRDFYRWRVEYGARDLSELARDRLGVDFGQITDLQPVERGYSGRLIKLRVVGEKKSLVIGKELEIRRALSRSHLYSSAFVVERQIDAGTARPCGFTLAGAGWGHGVGLCQIGAAAMAAAGFGHKDILTHYFRGAAIDKLY